MAKKVGRPEALFTESQLKKIDNSAYNQCKDNVIAEALGIPYNTFKGHFRKRCAQKRAEGKMDLHAEQMEMAKKNIVMAIWLGKQHLEQSDKQELAGPGGIPLVPKIIIFAKKEENNDDTK